MKRSKHRTKYSLPGGSRRWPPGAMAFAGILLAVLCWGGWVLIRVPDKKSTAAKTQAPKQNVNELKVARVEPAQKVVDKPSPNTETPKPAQAEKLPSPVTTPHSNPPIVLPEAPPAKATPAVPDVDPNSYPRPVRDLFEAQVALARHAICPGPIDGVRGSQSRAALRAFQRSADLPETGVLDPTTRMALTLQTQPLKNRVLTAEDFARLHPLSSSWLGKSQQSRLAFESIGELLAEEGRCSVKLLQKLNESVDWSRLDEGSVVVLPSADPPPISSKAACILIHLAERTLWLLDDQDRLIAHFPCSIARRVDKRPTGKLTVQVIIPNPDYTFDPKVFPESAEGRQLGRKLILPPGPNNPVGVAWIGLSLPGYGIHGTPNPEQVGRTESHGCFRLANWNAALLLKLAWVGMPVLVE